MTVTINGRSGVGTATIGALTCALRVAQFQFRAQHEPQPAAG